MSQPEGFRYKVTVEARFADVDMMRHVNHAKFFTFMEQARITYFEQVVGVDRFGEESVILADACCSFKAPLFYQDQVDVWLRVSRLGNKSFEQEYRLIRQSDGLLVATGQTVTVAYHYQQDRTVPLPEAWRERIMAYEPALDSGGGIDHAP